MTRVLATADAIGGVWPYALDLARGAAAHGIETVLAVTGPSPTPAQHAAASTARVTLIDTGLPLDWLAEDADAVGRAGDAIASLAARHGADIVQLNAPALGATTLFPAPVLGVAHSCVATWWSAVRGTAIIPKYGWRAALHGAGLRAAARTVAPSRAFAERTRAAYGLSETPRVVHNGRALSVPAATMHDFAFTAGRLWDEGKNLDVLDRAAARLGVPLRAAGPLSGGDGAHVTLRHVHALGTLDEAGVARWLAARPVFVSAATYEPFGLAVLEAALAGCALVLADTPVFRELWDGAAVFATPGDDAAFAAAIEGVVRDGLRRERLGAAAKAHARRYSVEAMATAMAALYAELAPARQAVAA